ncbi:hypothetical protein AM394_06710 [Klebsiella oxytoca]|nr:hypothetical protein AM394_06710 [Klebsiella oxytoca]
MSVPNQTPYNIYTANGLTTVFAYEFYLISASDIQVTINGNEVTSGYTVSGVGNTGGGEVTFLTAPANGSTVIFERVTPTYRLTDYQDNGDLLADTVNKDFDRLWMAIQRAFIYLGVALTRPLFGGGPFNANGYRIANLADPVDDQDAATKKYVVENGNTNLAKTLRVPESYVDALPSVLTRRNSLLGWDSNGRPIPVFSMTETADLAIKLASSEEGLGDNLVTHVPTELDDQITTVNQALSAQAPTLWQYARYVTDRPTTFPSTWDWGPAFQAAHDNGNVGPLLINGETYTVRTPVVYEYTDDDYTKYSRLPRCLSGSASIDYSELGNGGAGFNDSLEVDDAAQPAYVTAFTVKGASGYVVLQEFEGIVFRGNKNTAAIKLIGCDGIRPNRCTFTTNRYGVVFNNGSAAGTYAELNSPTFCRFRGGCLTAIAYEKGGGDTSFHGCGLGEGCFVTVAAGRSPVLIGAGCQPYNAPMNANFWTTGTSAPIIRNKSSLPAHFHGEMKWEGSFGTVMASGGLVYFYGALPRWAGIDMGTMRQALNGGPTGSAGGNLAFSGILVPTTSQWTVANLGTQVVFMDYNEEATVSVVGESYFATFKIQTARRLTNNCTTLPFQLISGNVNPLTKFSITRTSQGLRLTTIENNTKIVVWRQRGMPDQSSGINYNVTDRWTSI